jgi:hypothetical protein
MKRIIALAVIFVAATILAADTTGFRPLFNGKDLTGWKLRKADGYQSWSVKDGILVNDVSGGKHGTDLVSEQKFRDFVVRYEYKIAKRANSGLYLRGRHEIQIVDDFERSQPTKGGNGAIYQIAPVAKFASKPADEWQTAETTIKGDKVTVILNGEKVHENVTVDKATGGELDKNLDQPGPIMLQGDHGSISFRKIEIKELK